MRTFAESSDLTVLTVRIRGCKRPPTPQGCCLSGCQAVRLGWAGMAAPFSHAYIWSSNGGPPRQAHVMPLLASLGIDSFTLLPADDFLTMAVDPLPDADVSTLLAAAIAATGTNLSLVMGACQRWPSLGADIGRCLRSLEKVARTCPQCACERAWNPRACTKQAEAGEALSAGPAARLKLPSFAPFWQRTLSRALSDAGAARHTSFLLIKDNTRMQATPTAARRLINLLPAHWDVAYLGDVDEASQNHTRRCANAAVRDGWCPLRDRNLLRDKSSATAVHSRAYRALHRLLAHRVNDQRSLGGSQDDVRTREQHVTDLIAVAATPPLMMTHSRECTRWFTGELGSSGVNAPVFQCKLDATAQSLSIQWSLVSDPQCACRALPWGPPPARINRAEATIPKLAHPPIKVSAASAHAQSSVRRVSLNRDTAHHRL